VKAPAWSEVRALTALKIERVPFYPPRMAIAKGFARERSVAISPIALHAHTGHSSTSLAHVLLGHTAELAEGMVLTVMKQHRGICEKWKLECVAMLCSRAGLSGAEFSRGYIQHWIKV